MLRAKGSRDAPRWGQPGWTELHPTYASGVPAATVICPLALPPPRYRPCCPPFPGPPWLPPPQRILAPSPAAPLPRVINIRAGRWAAAHSQLAVGQVAATTGAWARSAALRARPAGGLPSTTRPWKPPRPLRASTGQSPRKGFRAALSVWRRLATKRQSRARPRGARRPHLTAR